MTARAALEQIIELAQAVLRALESKAGTTSGNRSALATPPATPQQRAQSVALIAARGVLVGPLVRTGDAYAPRDPFELSRVPIPGEFVLTRSGAFRVTYVRHLVGSAVVDAEIGLEPVVALPERSEAEPLPPLETTMTKRRTRLKATAPTEPIERTMARALVARSAERRGHAVGLPQGIDYAIRLPLRAAILLERLSRGRDHGTTIAVALGVFDALTKRAGKAEESEDS